MSSDATAGLDDLHGLSRALDGVGEVSRRKCIGWAGLL